MKKLLVANRGEIACRIFRTAREMGIKTVAVASEADRNARHVREADEWVLIGPAPASESYLRIDAILAAMEQTGADAVHPGYGFLSERDEFSEAAEAAGKIFVGPPASAMRKLGSKIDAKTLAVEANVPIVPGFFRTDATPEELREAADSIGYPVLLKASAGGGGRGMRVVPNAAEFDQHLRAASEEAMNAFGDGAMMVEKLVLNPRHVEVQVIADCHGNVACLFERECSPQRRHQKLVEEAPAPLVGIESLWPEMRDACRRLFLAAGYVGAGTVEFIFDAETSLFYFLEVNARLQVEHPVTEAITGLDLVKLQLEVAQGLPLDLSAELLAGDRRVISGWAMEARIIAEDPSRGFLPSVGKLVGWAEPQRPGVRVDSGFQEGDSVPQFYDSLLAKLVVHGPTREDARKRLEAALEDFHVLGVRTNISFLLDLIRHPDFVAGRTDTKWVERTFADWEEGVPSIYLGDLLDGRPNIPSVESSGGSGEVATGSKTPAWSQNDGWRNARFGS